MNTVEIPPSFTVQSLTITVIVLFYACGSPESEKQINDPFEGVTEIVPQTIAEITGESDSGGTADFVFGSDFFEEITFDSSGELLLNNRGNMKILYFDAEGEYLGSFAGRGQGPGEFMSWPYLDVYQNDMLTALDRYTLRANIFERQDGSWSLLNDFSLEPKEHCELSDVFVLGSDRIAVIYSPDSRFMVEGKPGKVRLKKKIDLFSTSGELIEENWMEIPSTEYSAFSAPGGGGVAFPVLFGSHLLLDTGPEQTLYLAYTDQFAIDIYDLEANVTDSIRHSNYQTELTEAQREEAVEEQAGAVRMETDEVQQDLEDQLFEHSEQQTPPIKEMHVDRDTGHIIVKRHTFDESPNWLLLDENGQRIGGFRLDVNFSVHDFRHGRIAGALHEEETYPTVLIKSLPENQK